MLNVVSYRSVVSKKVTYMFYCIAEGFRSQTYCTGSIRSNALLFFRERVKQAVTSDGAGR